MLYPTLKGPAEVTCGLERCVWCCSAKRGQGVHQICVQFCKLCKKLMVLDYVVIGALWNLLILLYGADSHILIFMIGHSLEHI